MKKFHIMLIGLLSLMVSGTASAIDLSTGQTTDITVVQCTQLADDIKIVLSANVTGSVDCTSNGTWAAVSVCHTTGLQSNRSYNDTMTSTACSTAGGTYDASSGKCSGTTSGSKFPTATTANGTVSSLYPGANCSTSEAANQATTSVNAIP